MLKLIAILIIFQCHFASAQDWKKNHLVNGCRIYDMTGKNIRNFPGDMCLFFDDGSFLSANIKGLGLFDKKFNSIWHIDGNFHHQLNMSEDGQRILVLSSDLVKRNKEKARVDKLMVLTLGGKILFQVNADVLFKKAAIKENLRNDGDHILEEMKVKNEISHFNSFYEVPEIPGNKLSFLKKETLVINGRGDGIFFLSPDLQSVLRHVNISQSSDHKIHDVQVLKNGHLLLFNNLVAGRGDLERCSSVLEIDLKTNKIVFEFFATPESMFYSPVAGSVQQLDSDHLLFTHILNGTFIYSKSKKDLVSTIINTHTERGRFIHTQQVKSVDLSKFMGHWK